MCKSILLTIVLLVLAWPVSAEVFSPDGCEYQVKFPGPPNIENVLVPEFEATPEANFYGRDYFLRAACLSQVASRFFDKGILLAELKRFMEMSGLSRVDYRHNMTPMGIVARARGYKQLDKKWVTYVTVWYIGSRSALSISMGGLSSTYPADAVLNFELSVSLK